MRRRILMTLVAGVVAAGFGCRHVGGKHDCGAHPEDGVIQPPHPPYPTMPAPGLGGVKTPSPIPPAGTNGGDKAPGTLPVPMPKQ